MGLHLGFCWAGRTSHWTHTGKKKKKERRSHTQPHLSHYLSEASSTALQQLSCGPHTIPHPHHHLLQTPDKPRRPLPRPIQSAYTCNHALRPSDRSRPSPTGLEISYHCFEFSTWTDFTESRVARKRRAWELEIRTYFLNGERKMPDVTGVQCGRLTGE